MIRIACQKCRKKFRVDDSNVGKKAKCPGCGSIISIPVAEAASPSDLRSVSDNADEYGNSDDLSPMLPTDNQAEQSSDDPWDEVEEYPSSRPPRKRNAKPARPSKTQKSRSPLLYVGIGTGAVLIVLTSVGATLWLSGTFSKPPEHLRQDVAQPVGKGEENSEPKVARRDKTSAEWITEGSESLEAGDNEAALIAYSKAIDVDNQSAPAFNGRGVAYLRSEKLKAALVDFTKAIELKADEAKFYGNRAYVYQDQGNFGLAIADLSKAIKLEPQSAQWYSQRALVFSLMNDTPHEQSDLAQAETLVKAGKKEVRRIAEQPQRPGLRNDADRGIANAKVPANPAAAIQAPSKISVEVTFLFNDRVGRKPDTGAHVVLLPKDVKSLPVSVLFLSVLSLRDDDSKALEKAGAYYAKVGGTGKAVLNRVRPGTYNMFIISENTDCIANVRDLQKQIYERQFPGMNAGRALKNMHQEIIEVGERENLEFSHDFGLTAF